MAKKRAPSVLRQEYMKQRKRIKQFINRAQKRGYEFASNLVPTIPKRVTRKQVEKLQALKPADLYKKARYASEKSYGEIITGEQARQLERKLSAQKAAQTRQLKKHISGLDYDYNDYYQENEQGFQYDDNYSEDTGFYDRVIISNWRALSIEYKCRDLLISWIERCEGQFGAHETAVMIQTAAENGVGLGISIKPSDKQETVSRFLSEMLPFMSEVGQFTKDEIMDALEMEESYEPI